VIFGGVVCNSHDEQGTDAGVFLIMEAMHSLVQTVEVKAVHVKSRFLQDVDR